MRNTFATSAVVGAQASFKWAASASGFTLVRRGDAFPDAVHSSQHCPALLRHEPPACGRSDSFSRFPLADLHADVTANPVCLKPDRAPVSQWLSEFSVPRHSPLSFVAPKTSFAAKNVSVTRVLFGLFPAKNDLPLQTLRSHPL